MAEIALKHDKLAKQIETLKSQGKKVVLADGCFDLIHLGLVRYLKAAKALGDVVVLALNSDESVKRVKGEGRPLLPLEDRLGVLSAFETVDFVTSFNEDTVEPLLFILKPQIYAKGIESGTLGKVSFGGQVISVIESGKHSAEKVIQEILRKYGAMGKKN